MAMKARINPETGEIIEIMDDNGWEVPDPNPPVMPAGFKRPETLAEQVQRLVRTTISQRAAAEGFETFEEAEDFDIDDDFDPSTPYETFFDPVLQRDITPDEFERRGEYYRQRYAAAHEQYFRKMDQDGILAENLLRRAVRRDRPSPNAEPENDSPQDAPSSPPAGGGGGRNRSAKPAK